MEVEPDITATAEEAATDNNTGPTLPFDLARRVQLSRTTLIHLLLDDSIEVSEIEGCFVRALLEVQPQHEDYRVFTILRTVPGPPYNGFCCDDQRTTDVYLELLLPADLSTVSGTLFQLNSLSNREMLQSEFDEWRRTYEQEIPPHSVWEQRKRNLEAIYSGRRNRPRENANQRAQTSGDGQEGPPAGDPNAPSVAPVETGNHDPASHAPSNGPLAGGNEGVRVDPLNLAAEPMSSSNAAGVTGHQEDPAAAGAEPSDKKDLSYSPSVPPGRAVQIPNTADPLRAFGVIPVLHPPPPGPNTREAEEARQARLEDLQDQFVFFRKPDPHTRVPFLRTLERDLYEYLDKVCDAISTKRQSCVVCLQKVPTVITLPCRHKVLCPLCATQVNSCPMCRETVVELFEPVEP